MLGAIGIALLFDFRPAFLSKTLLFLGSPFVSVASRVGEGLRGGFKNYLFLRHLREENQKLRAENEALKSRIVNLEEELYVFRKLKDVSLKKLKYPKILARIIYKPWAPYEAYFIVDQGRESGLFPEAPVVTAVGGEPGVLVGQVVEVSWRYAKVLPLSAPSSAVDVLAPRSRERGLLRGQGIGHPCLLDYVPYGSDLREGDLLITSGMDALFPKGLRVGKVLKIYPERGLKFFEKIEVEPLYDFRKLEYVYILLRPREYKP